MKNAKRLRKSGRKTAPAPPRLNFVGNVVGDFKMNIPFAPKFEKYSPTSRSLIKILYRIHFSQTQYCMKHVPTLFGRLAIGLLALLPATLSAQAVNFSIKGTVTDGTGAPLVGVSVVLVEARQTSFTDLLGFYDLNGSAVEGNYIMEFRYFGFQTERRNVSISLGQANLTQDVTLGEDILNLENAGCSAILFIPCSRNKMCP